MKSSIKLCLYGGALVIFGLFAVYSTSIWKSFDQRLTVRVIQNIETVKAFNTFLDDTIVASTQKVLNNYIQDQGDLSGQVAVVGEIENQMDFNFDLELDVSDKLVDNGNKRVQMRNNYVLFFSQIRNLIIALCAVVFVFFLPMSWFKEKKFIYFVTIASFLFQLCVFIPGLAATNGEARGWVDLGPLPNMQPSEFFKLAYVFFMSYWLTSRRSVVNTKDFLMKFAIINAIILFIILLIPDIGTLFILALTGTIMAWYSGLSIKRIFSLFVVALLSSVVGLSVISTIYPDNYASSRITTFFTTDEEAKNKIAKREGWQIQQGLIAIGAGGLWGQGYGKGLQKMGDLPEAYSDMIFAAFSEEIGFVGNLFLFALYTGLFVLVLKEIRNLRDPQQKVLAIGLISLIVIQVFVHVGVNIEVLPNTGLTLPFVSHGGTALMINLIELTLLYKILQGRE